MTIRQIGAISILAGSTTYTFDKDHIKSGNIDNTVSILGSELSYDSIELELIAVDDYSFADVRGLPYGTPVLLTGIDEITKEKYFIEKVKRTNKTTWTLSCISAIGILDRKEHKGGMYTGQSFQLVANELIDGAFPFTCVRGTGDIPIYGWLPYQNARDNLRQLLFVTNVHIDKDDNGDVVFTTFGSSPVIGSMNVDNVYIDGAEESQDPVTKIVVSEHIYDYDVNEEPMIPESEYVTLYDNTDGYWVADELVKFSEAPIRVKTIKNENDDSKITLGEYGQNYAYVTGRGKLIGVPYRHSTFDIKREGNHGEAEREVSVSDVTLINMLNAENIADRLFEYYSVKQKLTANFIFNGEIIGRRYSFRNTFGDTVTGYLYHTNRSFTSRYLLKATGDFITGYIGNYLGNNYHNFVLLKGTGDWTVPSGVTRFTAVMIGGGDGGDSGLAGQPSSDTRGGTGGSGGVGGRGGEIFQKTFDNPLLSYHYRCGIGGTGGGRCVSNDEDLRNKGQTDFEAQISYFGIYHSHLGERSPYGFLNLLNSTRYGFQYNQNGSIHGGDGGTASADWSENGKASYYPEHPEVLLMEGGLAAWSAESNPPRQIQIMHAVDPNDTNTPPRAYGRVSGGGGGGAGQVPGSNGTAGSIEIVHEYEDGKKNYMEYKMHPGVGGNGGNGADGMDAVVFGCGGFGGYGGGGAGGMGIATAEDYTYEEGGEEGKKITLGAKSTREDNPFYGAMDTINVTLAELKELNGPQTGRQPGSQWNGDAFVWNGITYEFRANNKGIITDVDVYRSDPSELGSNVRLHGPFTLDKSAVLSGCASAGGVGKMSLYALRDSSTYQPYLYEDWGSGIGLPSGEYSCIEIGIAPGFSTNTSYFHIELKGGAIGGYGGAGGKGADGCVIVFY